MERRPGGPRSRRTTWMAVVWLAAASALASTGSAEPGSGCPPFDLENTQWGVLGRWRERGVSPAQQEAFIRQGVVPRFPVTLWPSSGPAPLHVGVIVHAPLGASPVTIEIDADGDGVPEVVDSREENLGYVYAKPGAYAAKLRVREADGRLTTYAAPVEVLTPDGFDAVLQGRWRAFTRALAAGDLPGAIECVHSSLRRRHERVLRAYLGTRVESFPVLAARDFRVIEARYRGIPSRPGATTPVDVRFLIDEDSVWRVSAFHEAIGDDEP